MPTEKPAPFRFTVNVPVPCEIRFIDIRPGKLWTDPDNGKTKKLPSQVSIKGKFGNADTICFLPGPAWKNIKSLAESGILTDPEQAMTDANNEGLEAVTSVPFRNGKVTLTIAKPAGERYESLVVDTGVVKASESKRVDSPYAPAKPAKPEPFDEPTAAERAAMLDAAMEGNDGDAGYEEFSAGVDEVAANPRIAPQLQGNNAGQFLPREAQYLALFERVAAYQVAVGKKYGFPVDGSSIQAATFSIFKA